ncbi:hypothetical protein F5X99DRAFT_284693 [Biscogniauxia marginata]|nr:hypothetical protein F5X99DRAFT_284693 [Biscogniauxia marginata]
MPTAHETTVVSKRSWEDPHPGERLPIPLGACAGLNVYSQTISGDAMGGVAAKALCANDGGPWVARRGVRGRHRNTIPKPLKIPANVPEEPEAKSAPLVSSRRCDVASTSSLRFLPLPDPLRPLEVDTDTETEVGTEIGTYVDEIDMDRAKLTPISQTSLSDFSNFLGISRLDDDDDDDDTSVTVVDPDVFARTNSADDLYGWEAELDRKISCEVTTANPLCECHHCPYRRADGGKRSLLHRVFSTSGRRTGTGV